MRKRRRASLQRVSAYTLLLWQNLMSTSSPFSFRSSCRTIGTTAATSVPSRRRFEASPSSRRSSSRLFAAKVDGEGNVDSVWENMARALYPEEATEADVGTATSYADAVTLLRVGAPALLLGASAVIAYPEVCHRLAEAMSAVADSEGVFSVVANDSSQYIQNILTTSGLTFTILVGQTYYFMYQQQEAIYLALFEEVTAAKSLLEQVALVSRGRPDLYQRMLGCVDGYVSKDLVRFDDLEAAGQVTVRDDNSNNVVTVADPLEEILFLTSVGEPSVVYQTVRSLRQARARRLGAIQRKLPALQVALLWTLAAVVLFSFPLLGAGVQSIGGEGILTVQSWYMGVLVAGVSLTLGIVNELRVPTQTSAYNAQVTLRVMVTGLREELDLRRRGVDVRPAVLRTADDAAADDS